MLQVIDVEAIETAISVLYKFECASYDALFAKSELVDAANAELLETCQHVDDVDYRDYFNKVENISSRLLSLCHDVDDLNDKLAYYNNARCLLEETINSEE